jgi:hypothetical protein
MDSGAGFGGCKRRVKFFLELGDRLCVFLDINIRYDSPDEEGETRRQFNDRFGIDSPEALEVDEQDEYLLDVFRHLSSIRDEGFNSVGPLLPSRIEEWCRVLGYRLLRDEILILLRLDTVYRNACAEEQERQNENLKRKGASSNG